LSIEIDSSLNYKYYGGKFTEKEGFYTGKISQLFWDSLKIQLERMQFEQLDSVYDNGTMDDLEMETFIFYGDKSKLIYAHRISLPKHISKFLFWLRDSYQKVQLTPSKDSLSFCAPLHFRNMALSFTPDSSSGGANEK